MIYINAMNAIIYGLIKMSDTCQCCHKPITKGEFVKVVVGYLEKGWWHATSIDFFHKKCDVAIRDVHHNKRCHK